jgi:hypothetical protein
MEGINEIDEYKGIIVYSDSYMEHGRVHLGKKENNPNPAGNVYIPTANFESYEPHESNPILQDGEKKVKPINVSDYIYNYIIVFEGMKQADYHKIIDAIVAKQNIEDDQEGTHKDNY